MEQSEFANPGKLSWQTGKLDGHLGLRQLSPPRMSRSLASYFRLSGAQLQMGLELSSRICTGTRLEHQFILQALQQAQASRAAKLFNRSGQGFRNARQL